MAATNIENVGGGRHLRSSRGGGGDGGGQIRGKFPVSGHFSSPQPTPGRSTGARRFLHMGVGGGGGIPASVARTSESGFINTGSGRGGRQTSPISEVTEMGKISSSFGTKALGRANKHSQSLDFILRLDFDKAETSTLLELQSKDETCRLHGCDTPLPILFLTNNFLFCFDHVDEGVSFLSRRREVALEALHATQQGSYAYSPFTVPMMPTQSMPHAGQYDGGASTHVTTEAALHDTIAAQEAEYMMRTSGPAYYFEKMTFQNEVQALSKGNGKYTAMRAGARAGVENGEAGGELLTHMLGPIEVLDKRKAFKSLVSYRVFCSGYAESLYLAGGGTRMFDAGEGYRVVAAEARCLAMAEHLRAHIAAVNTFASTYSWDATRAYLHSWWRAYLEALFVSNTAISFTLTMYPAPDRRSRGPEHLGGGDLAHAYDVAKGAGHGAGSGGSGKTVGPPPAASASAVGGTELLQTLSAQLTTLVGSVDGMRDKLRVEADKSTNYRNNQKLASEKMRAESERLRKRIVALEK